MEFWGFESKNNLPGSGFGMFEELSTDFKSKYGTASDVSYQESRDLSDKINQRQNEKFLGSQGSSNAGDIVSGIGAGCAAIASIANTAIGASALSAQGSARINAELEAVREQGRTDVETTRLMTQAMTQQSYNQSQTMMQLANLKRDSASDQCFTQNLIAMFAGCMASSNASAQIMAKEVQARVALGMSQDLKEERLKKIATEGRVKIAEAKANVKISENNAQAGIQTAILDVLS